MKPRDLNTRAGESYARCAARRKQIAHAEGFSSQRASQACNGDPTAWASRAAVGVHNLAASRQTDPSPVLVDLQAIHVEALVVSRSEHELEDLLWRALDEECDTQADEDRAEFVYCRTSDLDELIDHMERSTAVQIRVIALARALRDKRGAH